MEVRLSDFIIDFLVKKEIKDIFLVSGGGIMYLCDAVGRNKKIRYICNHHEQACATAAESYARFTNKPGAILVTTGPGGTNAITGVAGAWIDSIPIIVISGQVRTDIIADYKKLRQLAPQEINIVDIVKHITKYAKTVKNPETIVFELEKAFYLATQGRPGPVWLDIPLNIQSALIDVQKLPRFSPVSAKLMSSDLDNNISAVVNFLKKSKRPILIAGNGIRLANAIPQLEKLISKFRIPYITQINSVDLLPHDNPFFQGIYGPNGQRRANFALQNADLVLSIGASLNLTSTGFNYDKFAPRAEKIMVNIDKGELTKKTLKIDMPILCDAKLFITQLLDRTLNVNFAFSPHWRTACLNWKKKYPIILPEFFKDKNHVNSYVFMDILSKQLEKNDCLITGIGLDAVSFYQNFTVKEGVRAFVNKNFGQMGWCLPAAVGACIANRKGKTVLVAGDGSLQFNIQELATIMHYKLPLMIFVFSNHGYSSIRNTQTNLFSGRFVGADESSGVTLPDLKSLAATYNLAYGNINNNSELTRKIQKALKIKGPALFEVNLHPAQARIPRSQTVRLKDGSLKSSTLENMYPFLPEAEVYQNMHLFDGDNR